jgi:hypothetical protein
MANPNAPFGFRSVAPLNGGVYGRQNSDYNIVDQLAQNIGIGDIVYFTAAAAAYAPAVDPRFAGQYIVSTVTGAPAGVFCGAAWQDTLGNYIWGKNWISGGVTYNAQGAIASVETDLNNTVFEAQVDVAGFIAAEATGPFLPISAHAAPNALGISSTVLAGTTPSATCTSSAIFRVLKLSPTPGNVYGPYAKLYGLIAFNVWSATTAPQQP